MTEIKSFLGTIVLTLRKLLRGENAIADYEDIQSRRMIYYSCEFLTGITKKTFSYLKRYGASYSSSAKYHKIKNGDTLYGLALKYSTSLNKICKLNNIKATKILQVGEKIRVR